LIDKQNVIILPLIINLSKLKPDRMFFTELFQVIIASTIAFIVSVAVIPSILKVAREKKLFDPPDERKVHTASIPPLGGIAIFIAFNLSVIFSMQSLTDYSIRYLVGAVIIMFFLGLKDDLINISARKKFLVQGIAVFILFFFGEQSISNLHGFMGLYEIPLPLSGFITFFVMLSIINAFNLIDGIDGLASGLAILASCTLGTWFLIAGHSEYSILAFALAGSLVGFFLFNVFGNRNKLFLGDTGSLVVGIIIAALIVRFNEFNINKSVIHSINAAPSLSFAIVMVPLIDTLRVMTIRILSGRSPFSPDKNHIHHKLLQLYPSHLTVTLIMLSFNIIMISLAFILNKYMPSVTLQFMIIFTLSIFMSFLPSYMVKWLHVNQIQKEITQNRINYNFKNLESNQISSRKKMPQNV